MTKEAIFKRIALDDGYITDKSMFAVEDDRGLVYKAMDEYARQQAVSFFKFCFSDHVDFEPYVSKRYDQFLEHQNENK